MKLHAFDFETMGRRYRALTPDKARKAIKKAVVTVEKDDLRIFPNQWKYVGPISTTGLSENEHVRAIHTAIRQRGCAIVSMPPIHRNFFVYDKQLDIGDIRIYSTDKELAEFNRFWHRMEMRPDGDAFKGTSPKFVGEVKISDASVAKTMGVDFDVLQGAGFEVHFIRQADETEAYRRGLERTLKEELPKKFANSGIEFTDIRVDQIYVHNKNSENKKAQENIQKDPDVTDKSVHIENYNIVNTPSQPVGSDTTVKQDLGFFDSWWVKALGLVAALLAIWAFFRDDIQKYINTQ